jgi:hypothetical protein
VSKFKSIISAAKSKESFTLPTAEAEQPSNQEAVAQGESKKRGRPKGKRSDPDYEQVTAYIRKTTHTSVKIALLQENQGREFSELVEELLNQWLKEH